MKINSADETSEVPGAKPTLPVSIAKKPFGNALIAGALEYWSNCNMQMGGEHSRHSMPAHGLRKMMNHCRSCFLVAVLMDGLAGSALAAETSASDVTAGAPKEMTADEVARELANPNTPLARLTLRNQWLHWDGDLPGANGSNSGTFQFQPAFPFPVGERKNIFFRPSLTYLVDQPVVESSTGKVGSQSGFADIGYDLAYGYATKSGWQTVVGMVGSFPTGTSDLSSRTWTLGPVAWYNKVSLT